MLAVIVILVLQALGLGVTLAKHGKPAGKHNFCLSVFSVGMFWLCVWWLDVANCSLIHISGC